jgi:hypothetical protein
MQFMHERNVAHRQAHPSPQFRLSDQYIRDCNGNNIMLDPTPLFPQSFHPVKIDRSRDFRKSVEHYSRRDRPVKYYFIDFGLSRRYRPEERPPAEPIIIGGDRTAPEHQGSLQTCDPFPTDVYYIGNMIREEFLQVFPTIQLCIFRLTKIL